MNGSRYWEIHGCEWMALDTGRYFVVDIWKPIGWETLTDMHQFSENNSTKYVKTTGIKKTGKRIVVWNKNKNIKILQAGKGGKKFPLKMIKLNLEMGRNYGIIHPLRIWKF